MTGYTVAVWSTLILAELFIISVVLNLVCLRRWRTQGRNLPPTVFQLVEAATSQAKGIKEAYRQMISACDVDVPALRENLQMQENELAELLRSQVEGAAIARVMPHTKLLQPLWNDMHESHALLNVMSEQLVGKAQSLQAFMAQKTAQARLLQELTALSIACQKELEEVVERLPEGPSIAQTLEELEQRSQKAQRALQELEDTHHALLTQDEQYRGFFEQYRGLLQVLQTLRQENLCLSEKAQTQEHQLEELRQEKVRLEGELERLKGVEETYAEDQKRAIHLKEQLQRADQDLQQLRGELTALTAEYLKLFERQAS